MMEALLVRKGLWEVVSGAESQPLGSLNHKAVKAWKKKSMEGRAEIILNVEPSQLAHVRSPEGPAVWANLCTIHQARGFGTRMARRRAFFKMEKSSDTPISRWIADVRRAAFMLEEIGASMDDEDIIIVLANGLPNSYEHFVITLDSTPPADLTLNYVITRLLNEEARQLQTVPTVPTSAADDASALAAAAARQSSYSRTSLDSPRPRTPLERITCFRCGQKGHYQGACSVPIPAASTSPTAAVAATAHTSSDNYAF